MALSKNEVVICTRTRCSIALLLFALVKLLHYHIGFSVFMNHPLRIQVK